MILLVDPSGAFCEMSRGGDQHLRELLFEKNAESQKAKAECDK